MADVLFGHQAHGVLDRVIGRDGGDMGGEDVPHQGGVGGFALQGHLARVIPLGENAHELVVFDDGQGANVFLGQELNRLKHGGLGRNGPHGCSFVVQNRADSSGCGCHATL